jgi:hypothetical protein
MILCKTRLCYGSIWLKARNTQEFEEKVSHIHFKRNLSNSLGPGGKSQMNRCDLNIKLFLYSWGRKMPKTSGSEWVNDAGGESVLIVIILDEPWRITGGTSLEWSWGWASLSTDILISSARTDFHKYTSWAVYVNTQVYIYIYILHF